MNDQPGFNRNHPPTLSSTSVVRYKLFWSKTSLPNFVAVLPIVLRSVCDGDDDADEDSDFSDLVTPVSSASVRSWDQPSFPVLVLTCSSPNNVTPNDGDYIKYELIATTQDNRTIFGPNEMLRSFSRIQLELQNDVA